MKMSEKITKFSRQSKDTSANRQVYTFFSSCPRLSGPLTFFCVYQHNSLSKHTCVSTLGTKFSAVFSPWTEVTCSIYERKRRQVRAVAVKVHCCFLSSRTLDATGTCLIRLFFVSIQVRISESSQSVDLGVCEGVKVLFYLEKRVKAEFAEAT